MSGPNLLKIQNTLHTAGCFLFGLRVKFIVTKISLQVLWRMAPKSHKTEYFQLQKIAIQYCNAIIHSLHQ